LVEWLVRVIEEEGKRAERISSSEGELVRPMDLETSGEGGPLSTLEKSTLGFFQSIRSAESARLRAGILRPKDLDESVRGPLGEAEARAVTALNEIARAEVVRMEQSRTRGGEIVRPIDIPGPLGEIERKWVDLTTAEKKRAKEGKLHKGKIVRPKDSAIRGPLGEAEKRAVTAFDSVKKEETDRFQSIQKVLENNRPMGKDKLNILGMLERLFVEVVNAPFLFKSIFKTLTRLIEKESKGSEKKPGDNIISKSHFKLDERENIEDFKKS